MNNPGFIPKDITPFPRILREDVIGRSKEIEILRNILARDKKSALLKGPDGIGKTTLAALFVSTFYEDYDHIVWLTNENSFEEAILTNYPLQTNLMVQQKDAKQRVEECLSKISTIRSDKPGLFVLDDADVNLSVFYGKLPKAPDWHVLITSKERLSPFQMVETGPLTDEESVQLFLSHCDAYAADQVRSMIQPLDLHTLLIEVLAKTCCSNHLAFDMVHEALVVKTQKSLSSSLLYGQKGEDTIKAFLAAIFDLNDTGENEAWLLKQFLALPGEWISYGLLKQLTGIEKLEWHPTFHEKLGKLSLAGYLQHNPWTCAYRMHPLLRDALVKKLGVGNKDISTLIENVSSLLNDAVKTENPSVKFQFISHVEAILKVYPENRLYEVASLHNQLAGVYQELGEIDHARDLLERALEATLENYGEKHPEIAVHQSNLAHIYRDLGEYEEARDLYENALRSDLENFGEKHPAVAMHHSNLAHVYKDLGDFEKARELLEQTLKIDLELYEPTHPFISQAQSNLATIYKNLGEYEKARDFLETSMKSDLVNFGEDHPTISVTRSNLASIYRILGEYEKARDLMEAALKSDQANLGEKHPNIAVGQSVLANIYAGMGDYENAKVLWEKALRSNLENFGENHPNVALCQSNLASVYSDLGAYEKARDLLEEALKSDLINFGEKHPYVALSQSNLANVYYNIGEHEAARDLFEKTLHLHKVLYEPDHPFIAQVQSNLANVYADLGEFDKACGLLTNTLETDKLKLGDHHPKVAIHQSNLANLYADFGEVEKAHDLWDSAYKILVNSLGHEHPNTKAVKGFLDEIGSEQSN